MTNPLALDIRLSHLKRFETHARKIVPSFRVRGDKRRSYLMNVIQGYLYPFNSRFMSYVTTIGTTVYIEEERLSRYPDAALEILAHEFIHAYDHYKRPFLFGFLYLFPLPLVPVALALYGIFAGSLAVLLPVIAALIHLGAVKVSHSLTKLTGFPLMAGALGGMAVVAGFKDGLTALWLLGALVPALPLPAPGRYWAELRGYGMSLHAEQWLYGNSNVESKVRQFTGWAYYRMWPFKKAVHDRLQAYADQAKRTEENPSDLAFSHVATFFGRLKRNS